MGLQRTPLSLHLIIFEKGSLTLLPKTFYKLSTKLFMGFYFWTCRENVLFKEGVRGVREAKLL
jgi:hypothetical protein